MKIYSRWSMTKSLLYNIQFEYVHQLPLWENRFPSHTFHTNECKNEVNGIDGGTSEFVSILGTFS